MTTPALRHHLPAFLAAVLFILAPPAAPRRLSEVAGSLRITEGRRGPRPEAPQGDLLDVHEHRGWRGALRLFAAGRHRVCVVIGPPQDGKDTNVCAPILVWAINDLRRPMVYATTDKRLMGALWRAKIESTMRASGYAHLFPDDGMGSSGGTPDEFLFQNGVRTYLLGAGASNGAGQAGVSAWGVLITEADKLRTKQRELLMDRNKSYAEERQSLLIGTIDRNGGGGLMDLYNESTMGRMNHPCRHCGAWQPLEPEQIQYDKTNADLARSTARIKCRALGCLWNEDDRKWSVARGEEVYAGQSISGPADAPIVTGEPIAAEYGGLRIWSMDSPFRSLPEYCADELSATTKLAKSGDPEPLAAFTRAEKSLPYVNRDEVLELRETDLALRSAAAVHRLGQAPDDADVCTVGIDQQLRRLLFVVLAYRIRDGQWWIIDHGQQGICVEGEEPTDAQSHHAFALIEQRILRGYARPSGSLLMPMMVGVDTADGITRPRALSWMQGRPGWNAIRGQGGDYDASDAAGEAVFRLPGVLSIHNQTKTLPPWLQIAIAVDLIKGEVTRDLARDRNAPGAGHLPQGEGSQDHLIQELCAERQEQTTNGPVWVQKRRHNHRFDCTIYAKALAKYLAHLRTLNHGGTNTATDYADQMAKG